MAKETVLHRVRTALGRSAGQAVPEPPPVYFNAPKLPPEDRVEAFRIALESLAGKVVHAQSQGEARDYVGGLIAGKTAVASNAPYLEECGIRALPEVQGGVTDKDTQRQLCASCDFGITSADYALANTGSLVMLASPAEQRLVSLLPPVHIAVLPVSRLLSSLDELLVVLPNPAEQTSSMVLITGPSRSADIELILVRGVHGPGEIHVVLVETEA